jgi:FkbM family methyltransferase
MIRFSRARRYESVQDGECTDCCIAAGLATKVHNDVTARIAGHTFLPSLIGPSSVVLDIGANQGQFARAIVRDFDCRVHAVEPNPYLCASLQELAIPGVTVHGVALAGTRGLRPFLVMNNSEASHVASANDSKEGTVQVQTITLEDLISQIPATASIDLIKMDIEGAELDVLEHVPAGLLERVRQLTIEFHQFVYPESRVRVEAVKKRLSNLGFWVVDFSRTNYDVLFVQPAASVSLRIRASVLFEKYHLRFTRGLSYWLHS